MDITAIGVLEDLSQRFGIPIHARVRTWTIPAEVVPAARSIKIEFLQGFFDSEGCVSFKPEVSRRNITAGSSSRAGLNGVRELLGGFGITAHLYRTKSKGGPFWTISIHDYQSVQAYFRSVAFANGEKAALLREMSQSYKRFHRIA